MMMDIGFIVVLKGIFGSPIPFFISLNPSCVCFLVTREGNVILLCLTPDLASS